MIVKQLTISQMSSIALLQENDLLTRRILSFLLQGKPILVLETLPAIPKETPLKYQVKKDNSRISRQMSAVWSDILSLPARLC